MPSQSIDPSSDSAPQVYLVAQLNARLQPMHREEFFERALDAELKSRKLGEISGGGTLQTPDGEVDYCDIEVEVHGNLAETCDVIIRNLEALGAPKGSKLHVEAEDRKIPFGSTEGIAVYLNGTDLPDEVYRDCDSNFVYSEFDRLLQGNGRVLSYWQGPTETAFYAYGNSFEHMHERLSGFLATYPLCQKCRVIQVA